MENQEEIIEETNPEAQERQNEEQPELSPEEYRNLFIALRQKYDRKIYNKGSIEAEKIMQEAYTEVCESAVMGDAISQSLLAYWFKHGNPALPENIEYSMKWLILSGANQNKHSIDKLAMLFTYVYDTIAYTEEFQNFAVEFDLTEQNYKYCLGPIICSEIVKSMNIDAYELSQARLFELEFNSATMNRFSSAANKSVDVIMEGLRKANEKIAKS